MLKQTQSQKISQKHLPKIVLNQNILSIPVLALDNIIKRELELNPVLEEGTEQESDFELKENEELQNENSDNAEAEGSEEISTEDSWDDYFENEQDDFNYSDHSARSDRTDIESNIASQENKSVKEALTLQLHLSDLNEKQVFIGEEIIWSLNDAGYFSEDSEEILKDINSKKENTKFSQDSFSADEMKHVLSYIQKKFDPPGIAARNLRECMSIQIDRSNAEEKIKHLSLELIEKYFDDLKLKKYEKITKDLNTDLETVKKIVESIHKLNPKPGSSELPSPENYIVPDLIVKKVNGSYEIFLNDRYTPSIRISKVYKDMYSERKKGLDSDTKNYLVNNFNKAKWFMEAINSRRETMLKIMEAILKRQKEFFDNNGEGMKQLYEKDIAEDVKMDSSTISRAVRGKYVQTDFGIYELRSFFSTPLATDTGEVSNTEVKVKLKEIIQNEDKTVPLTDEELSVLMKNSGYRIARRTVTKYRESMNIPAAKLRREI